MQMMENFERELLNLVVELKKKKHSKNFSEPIEHKENLRKEMKQAMKMKEKTFYPSLMIDPFHHLLSMLLLLLLL